MLWGGGWLGGGMSCEPVWRALRRWFLDVFSWYKSTETGRMSTYVSAALAVVTVLACFTAWLAEGYKTFLPFISDFGLSPGMRFVFTVGLVLASLLLGPFFANVVRVRWLILQSVHPPRLCRAANVLAALCSFAVVLGLFLIGFFPWDQVLWVHLVCASFIFSGGMSQGMLSSFMWWRLVRGPLASQAHLCSMPVRRRQLAFVAAGMAASAFGLASMIVAAVERPDMFTFQELPIMLRLAHDDFGAYCSGAKGWHQIPWVNLIALAEWLLTAALIGTIFTAQADIDTYFALMDQGLLSGVLGGLGQRLTPT